MPEDLETVTSSKQYYSLIYLILREYKEVKNAELEFSKVLEKLKKIAEDNFENEGDYLITEIQALTGEELNEHYLSLFELSK